jgi:pimeloyl-ACP methyl ester carboxylesterase
MLTSRGEVAATSRWRMSMSTYVLVHGGWAGSWVWERVAPMLAAEGHNVIAVDLPAHGSDPTPLEAVTLDTYVDRVAAVLRNRVEPVILVGHSSGGVVVTQLAEQCPERLLSAVFISAFVPADGQTLFDLFSTDTESVLLSGFIASEDGTRATVAEGVFGEALFADCSESDLRAFIARAVPEPLRALAPVKVTPERFGSVPKVFVQCLRDRALSPALQQQMLAAAQCQRVLSIDTGHMPMYAAPEKLADMLLTIATPAMVQPNR